MIAALTLAAIVFGLGIIEQSALHRRAGRRRVLQSDPARLRHPGGARHRRSRCVTRDVRPHGLSRRRGGRPRSCSRSSYLTLEVRTLYHGAGAEPTARPPMPSNTPIRRSGSPSAWCCCWSASRSALAAGAARLGRGRLLTVAQGVPGRHVRSDRHLSARCPSSGSASCWSASAGSISGCCFRAAPPPPHRRLA